MQGLLEFANETLKLETVDLIMIPVSALLFLSLWAALKRTLFDPCIALVEKREALTIGAQETAADTIKRAEQIQAAYEEHLTQARIESMRKKIEILNQTRAQAAGVLQKAQENAQSTLLRERREIAAQVKILRDEALGSADQLAEAIAAKLSSPAKTPEQIVH